MDKQSRIGLIIFGIVVLALLAWRFMPDRGEEVSFSVELFDTGDENAMETYPVGTATVKVMKEKGVYFPKELQVNLLHIGEMRMIDGEMSDIYKAAEVDVPPTRTFTVTNLPNGTYVIFGHSPELNGNVEFEVTSENPAAEVKLILKELDPADGTK